MTTENNSIDSKRKHFSNEGEDNHEANNKKMKNAIDFIPTYINESSALVATTNANMYALSVAAGSGNGGQLVEYQQEQSRVCEVFEDIEDEHSAELEKGLFEQLSDFFSIKYDMQQYTFEVSSHYFVDEKLRKFSMQTPASKKLFMLAFTEKNTNAFLKMFQLFVNRLRMVYSKECSSLHNVPLVNTVPLKGCFFSWDSNSRLTYSYGPKINQPALDHTFVIVKPRFALVKRSTNDQKSFDVLMVTNVPHTVEFSPEENCSPIAKTWKSVSLENCKNNVRLVQDYTFKVNSNRYPLESYPVTDQSSNIELLYVQLTNVAIVPSKTTGQLGLFLRFSPIYSV